MLSEHLGINSTVWPCPGKQRAHSPASSEHGPKLHSWVLRCEVKHSTAISSSCSEGRASCHASTGAPHLPSAPTATGQPGQCQTTGGSQCCSQLLAHPRRWGIPCLNCSGHSRAPPHTTTAQWHRPAPTQCGEDATENSRLSGNPRDQTGTHSCCARARLRSQIPCFLCPSLLQPGSSYTRLLSAKPCRHTEHCFCMATIHSHTHRQDLYLIF